MKCSFAPLARPTSLGILFTLLTLAVFPSPSSAQILAVDDDSMGEVILRVPHTGLTLAGTTGLVTVPTPDHRKTGTVSASYKGSIDRRYVTYGSERFRISRNQQLVQVAANVAENLELSCNHLRFQRSSSPWAAPLNYPEDATAFGMKYSTSIGDKDLCFGGSFAPMTAEEMNRADLNQIEALRNVYLTVTEQIADDCQGYLHLKEFFTDRQLLDLGNGRRFEINRKEVLASALGLEIGRPDRCTFFAEWQFLNLRDLYRGDTDRHSVNAGVRLGTREVQLELFGISLNQDPYTTAGIALSF